VKEVFPGGAIAANLGFEGVGEDAEGVGVKELGNISFVVVEVVIEGGLEFDIRVFEFDEDEGQPVDVEQDIGSAVGAVAFNPELGDGEKLILAGGAEIIRSLAQIIFCNVISVL